jgi:hypothetical protein
LRRVGHAYGKEHDFAGVRVPVAGSVARLDILFGNPQACRFMGVGPAIATARIESATTPL